VVVVPINLLRRDGGSILATFNLEAASHVKCAVRATDRLLLLPAEMKIWMPRVANGPAALITQERVKGLSLVRRYDWIVAR